MDRARAPAAMKARAFSLASDDGKLSLSLRSLVAGTVDARGPTWDTCATHVLPRAVAATPQPQIAAPMVMPAPQAAPKAIAQRASSIVVRGVGATTTEVTP